MTTLEEFVSFGACYHDIYTLTSHSRSVELTVAVSGTSTSRLLVLSDAQIIALLNCELSVVQSSCEYLTLTRAFFPTTFLHIAFYYFLANDLRSSF